MSREPEPSLHDAADAALAALAVCYRVTVDESRDRAVALDPPPPPDFLRLVRLVPDGTDGESLTVVLTADGGLAVHVRRSRVLVLSPGADDALLGVRDFGDVLAWPRR